MTMKKGPGRPRADDKRDLRADLLNTSRALLDENGPAGLSMREVARRAGCTHQAPYHYFEDRESILAALVSDGFEQLASRLEQANDLAARHGTRAALIASARAYVGFALEQPGVFRIMFRPDACNPARFPMVQESGKRAHAQLERLSHIASGGKAPKPALETILWAHVHGLAGLLLDGPLDVRFATEAARTAHLDEVAEAFADQITGAHHAPGDGDGDGPASPRSEGSA